jgi:hypothetical protein
MPQTFARLQVNRLAANGDFFFDDIVSSVEENAQSCATPS